MEGLDGRVIAVFLVEDFELADEGKVYQIRGTAAWNGKKLRIRDVSWGQEFDMPGELLDIICPADEHTRSIVPDADYAICMPLALYPYPWW